MPKSYTDEQLIEAAKQSSSISEIFGHLGLSKSGDSYTLMRQNLERLNLSLQKPKQKNNPQRTIDQIFQLDTDKDKVRKTILDNKLLPYKCQDCDVVDTWQGNPLTLHLDHINGNNRDNRLENLRFLCPNCHSQTDTFCGRNSKYVTKKTIPNHSGQ